MELYFKIKLIETIIGYGLLGLFILFWLVVLLVNIFGNNWDKRQERKAKKFWNEKE